MRENYLRDDTNMCLGDKLIGEMIIVSSMRRD